MAHKRPDIPTIVFAVQIFGTTACFAQTCPDAQSGKNGFVVERGERSRTEVFHDGSVVRMIMRSGWECSPRNDPVLISIDWIAVDTARSNLKPILPDCFR